MRVPQRGAPVPAPDRQHAKLGDDDGRPDRRRDFLGGLDPEPDVAFRVPDHDDRFEARALAGSGLFLYGLDLLVRGLALGGWIGMGVVMGNGMGWDRWRLVCLWGFHVCFSFCPSLLFSPKERWVKPFHSPSSLHPSAWEETNRQSGTP